MRSAKGQHSVSVRKVGQSKSVNNEILERLGQLERDIREGQKHTAPSAASLPLLLALTGPDKDCNYEVTLFGKSYPILSVTKDQIVAFVETTLAPKPKRELRFTVDHEDRGRGHIYWKVVVDGDDKWLPPDILVKLLMFVAAKLRPFEVEINKAKKIIDGLLHFDTRLGNTHIATLLNKWPANFSKAKQQVEKHIGKHNIKVGTVAALPYSYLTWDANEISLDGLSEYAASKAAADMTDDMRKALALILHR